jgi:hypothetical protein
MPNLKEALRQWATDPNAEERFVQPTLQELITDSVADAVRLTHYDRFEDSPYPTVDLDLNSYARPPLVGHSFTEIPGPPDEAAVAEGSTVSGVLERARARVREAYEGAQVAERNRRHEEIAAQVHEWWERNRGAILEADRAAVEQIRDWTPPLPHRRVDGGGRCACGFESMFSGDMDRHIALENSGVDFQGATLSAEDLERVQREFTQMVDYPPFEDLPRIGLDDAPDLGVIHADEVNGDN